MRPHQTGRLHHPSIGTEPPAHLLEPEEGRDRYVRSPVYVLRAIVGAVMLIVGFLITLLFENALVGLFVDTTAMVESWPEWIQDLPVVVMAGIAAAVIFGAALWLIATRHWRRLVVVSVAGAGTVLASLASTQLVMTAATSDVLANEFASDDPARRLSLFLPALIAVVTIGLPWLRRSIRSWVIKGTAAYGVALVFFAVTPPLVIAVDVGVGVLVGALVGIVFKTPNMAPTRAELAIALTNAGIPITDLRHAAVDARGSVPWFAETADDGPAFVKVLGSDHRAADLLFRVYRWVRFRDAGDRRPFVSLQRAVEHEAFTALQATNRHIATPRFLALADVGGDGVLLAYVQIAGRSLDTVDPSEVTDWMLDQTWDLVAHLHEHGIAHRDLRVANLMLGDDGAVYVIDFGFAEMAADDHQKAKDVAELLASTSAMVGAERALGSAIRVVQPAELVAAIPWLQPKAMSSATQAAVGDKKAFKELRALVQAATGADDVPEIKLERVRLATILTLVSLGLAVSILIPMIAGANDVLPTLRNADPVWVAIGLLASTATYAGAMVGILGAVPGPLPPLRIFVAQLASSFTNRVTPAKVGGLATNVRALQKLDVPTEVAVSAIGLNTLAGVAIHVPATVALGIVAGGEMAAFSVPSATSVGWIVAGFAALSAAVMLIPAGRRLVTVSLIPALRSAVGSISEVAHRPGKLAMLFGGSFTVTSMYVVAMAASLEAFGSDLDLVTLAFVYLAGSAVASAAPTPGGVGATEAALAAGYAAVGVPPEIAVSAVLLFRLLTFWLPILPGWLAFSWMQRTGRL